MDSVKERLPLARLARRGASLERQVDVAELPRFAALCQASSGVRVRLRFFLDAQGRTRMEGSLAAELRLQCHRCLAPVPAALRANFSVAIVRDGNEADRLGRKLAVLHLAGQDATLGELIEDELILSLPQRPCMDAACPQAPPRAFPADGPQTPRRSLRALGLLPPSGDNE